MAAVEVEQGVTTHAYSGQSRGDGSQTECRTLRWRSSRRVSLPWAGNLALWTVADGRTLWDPAWASRSFSPRDPGGRGIRSSSLREVSHTIQPTHHSSRSEGNAFRVVRRIPAGHRYANAPAST